MTSQRAEGLPYRFVTRAAAAIVLCASVAVTTATTSPWPVFASAPEDVVEPVILPGQDVLIADMLGRESNFPGGCLFTGGQIERTFIRARYACAAGAFIVELDPPGREPPAVASTARFAVSVAAGSMPAGFADALLSRIRAHEERLQWSRAAVPADSYAVWSSALRLNVLLFLSGAAAFVVVRLPRRLLRMTRAAGLELGIVILLTALAGVLRFELARPNLMDFGGIPYSRLLRGYKGYLGTAHFFSFLGVRDIEHAVRLNCVAGTLTIPLIYVLCRRLQPSNRTWPAIAAFLLAVYPLHISFSASDTVAVFSGFLAAASYVLLIGAVQEANPLAQTVGHFGALLGFALLTQVRYENILLLVPAVVFLFTPRARLQLSRLVLPLLIASCFVAVYAYQTLKLGLSFTTPIHGDAVGIIAQHLLFNPFMAVPLLLLGSAAVAWYHGVLLGAAALLVWIVALTLCAIGLSDGVAAARIYANWLILIVPFAAFGLSSMLVGSRSARRVAAVVLVLMSSLPLICRERLTTQYLEILEHERFAALLDPPPAGVTSIIVPDDELQHRTDQRTVEASAKYALILERSSIPAPRPQLVGITEFLEHPERTDCTRGGCAFFFGQPCAEEEPYYADTKSECAELLRTHHTSVISESSITSAPFVHCGIYVGSLWRQLCRPAIRRQRFTLYRIDDEGAVAAAAAAAGEGSAP